MGVWERFDKIANTDEVEEAKSQFKPLRRGQHTMVLEKLEPSMSKSGFPMLKGKLRTKDNKVVFYNQMLQNPNYPDMTRVNVAQAVAFVEGLYGDTIEFDGLQSFAKVIENMTDSEGNVLDEFKKDHIIEVSYGKKDVEEKFPQLKYIKVVEEYEPNEDIEDGGEFI